MTARRFLSLSLSHFRSYAGAALDFDGRPVVLWGPNGAGKTNILEALSMFSPGRGLRRAPGADLARAPGALGWRARAVLSGVDPVDVTLTGEPGGRRRVEIDGKAATQTALGRLVPMVWLTPAMDRLWIEGAEGRRRFIDRAALGFRPDHGAQVLRYERAMRERNILLREGRGEPRWLDALEARMAEAGVAIAEARAHAVARLGAAREGAAAGAATLFPVADIAMVGSMEQRFSERDADQPVDEGQRAGIMADFARALAAGRRADAAAGRALEGPHRSDLSAVMARKGVPAHQCSTGEQKGMLLGLVLANARALAADGTPCVLLLDEVAAHLDETRRDALHEMVCALSGQAFMTGTGPELFASLGDRALAFAVRETAEGSLVEAA